VKGTRRKVQEGEGACGDITAGQALTPTLSRRAGEGEKAEEENQCE